MMKALFIAGGWSGKTQTLTVVRKEKEQRWPRISYKSYAPSQLAEPPRESDKGVFNGDWGAAKTRIKRNECINIKLEHVKS